jgi:hypothetical protein
MRTPRPVGTRRGIGTLIGNGWLRESPRNLWPREWDIRGRSALRKCMFLPAPPGMKDLAPPVSPAAMPPLRLAKNEPPIAPHRHDPKKDVRMFAAVTPEEVAAKKRAELLAGERSKLVDSPKTPAPWYDDPVALGTLLIMIPPIGLAALWSSKRYSSDARWALTIMTALTMCLVSAIVIAVAALRA